MFMSYPPLTAYTMCTVLNHYNSNLVPISNVVTVIQVIQLLLSNTELTNYDNARATQSTNSTAANLRNETVYDELSHLITVSAQVAQQHCCRAALS